MKIEQCAYFEGRGWMRKTDHGLGAFAQIVFVFGNRDLLKSQEHIDQVRSWYPAAEIVGCSTAGEICQEEIYSGSLICTAVWFEKSEVRIIAEPVISAENNFETGERIACRLPEKDLVHIMVLSEGLNINGSELTKGLNSKLKNMIPITGGLAGDEAEFRETVLVYNRAGEKNIVLAIGFYGASLRVGFGCKGGWDSFGVDRLVTKSRANVLYELDGQPALALYKKYLGEHAASLPASALLFPLSLRLKDSENAVVRTILSVNEEDGSMVFAGDITQGEYVRLMRASTDKLVEGATGAAEMSGISLGVPAPGLAILISCVGRRLVMKQRVEEELESVRDILGKETVITGFYSYGEICPGGPHESRCELHNQTMTITTFKEI